MQLGTLAAGVRWSRMCNAAQRGSQSEDATSDYMNIDRGVALCREGQLTSAGQAESRARTRGLEDDTDMDSDVIVYRHSAMELTDDSEQLTQARVTRTRRAQKWAVDAQPLNQRPPACKLCAIPFSVPFSVDDVRVATWGSRTSRRWNCLTCIAAKLLPTDDFEAIGRGRREHCDALRAACQDTHGHNQVAVASEPRIQDTHGPSPVASEWEDDRLPHREWWEALSWSDATSMGSSTFVQVPDMLRGAFNSARESPRDLTQGHGRRNLVSRVEIGAPV